MTSMYQTSEQGIREIKIDVLRKMSIEDLEARIKYNPGDNLAFEVFQAAYKRINETVSSYRILNSKYPFEGS